MATVSQAKENILKRIRQALSNPAPLPFPESEGNNPVFVAPAEELAVLFALEFRRLQGKFAYCLDEADLQRQIKTLLDEKKWTKVFSVDEPWASAYNNTDDLATCDVSITNCEALVARTGTMVLSSAQKSGRTVSVYAPVHICIARTNQLVYDIRDAIQQIKEKYGAQIPSLISFATGPSRTADIEKTLVTGVHGPKEVYLFLVEA